MINSEALQRTYDKVRDKWDPNFEWVVNESAPWSPLQKPLYWCLADPFASSPWD